MSTQAPFQEPNSFAGYQSQIRTPLTALVSYNNRFNETTIRNCLMTPFAMYVEYNLTCITNPILYMPVCIKLENEVQIRKHVLTT